MEGQAALHESDWSWACASTRECCGTNSKVGLTARPPFTGSGGARRNARCQRFHLLLIVLRLTSADNGSRAACPGRGSLPTMTRSQGECRGDAIHSTPGISFLGYFSSTPFVWETMHNRRGASFAFNPDELFTRA